MWIKVRCSGGDGKGDPLDVCGDKKPDNPTCGNGQQPNTGQNQKATLQAYTDPTPWKNDKDNDCWYSRITFCNDFFKLNSLDDITKLQKQGPKTKQKNLQLWDNQARVFFHEVTHLDWFMNAPGKSPYVSDLEILVNNRGQREWEEAYGPYNARILRNYLDQDPQYSAYYTQRNADSYAWFAMAKYVEGQIGEYPSAPSPGKKKSQAEPRDAVSHGPPQLGETGPTSQSSINDTAALIQGDEQDNPDPFPIPACGDKIGGRVTKDDLMKEMQEDHDKGTQAQAPTGFSPPAEVLPPIEAPPPVENPKPDPPEPWPVSHLGRIPQV